MKLEVIKDWTAPYLDPIQLRAGEPLRVTGRTEIWDGHLWLWAENVAGKEGWIPDSLVSPDNPGVASRDYTAMELTCWRGQVLVAQWATHGWVFCQNEDDLQGWVPERNLIEIGNL